LGTRIPNMSSRVLARTAAAPASPQIEMNRGMSLHLFSVRHEYKGEERLAGKTEVSSPDRSTASADLCSLCQVRAALWQSSRCSVAGKSGARDAARV
jgi:hypothetical protein